VVSPVVDLTVEDSLLEDLAVGDSAVEDDNSVVEVKLVVDRVLWHPNL